MLWSVGAQEWRPGQEFGENGLRDVCHIGRVCCTVTAALISRDHARPSVPRLVQLFCRWPQAAGRVWDSACRHCGASPEKEGEGSQQHGAVPGRHPGPHVGRRVFGLPSQLKTEDGWGLCLALGLRPSCHRAAESGRVSLAPSEHVPGPEVAALSQAVVGCLLVLRGLTGQLLMSFVL